MHRFTTRIIPLLAIALVPTLGEAQALTNITSLYVSYNSRKFTTNPTGELKARLDSLDRDLMAANRLGRTGEVRRLLAKGNSLLANRPWSDVAEYNASLVLRTDRVVLDSRTPWRVRVEQLFAPDIALARALSAHVRLMRRPTGAGASQQLVLVKDLGSFDGVSRDLIESPFAMEFDIRDVADGRYTLAVEVLDSTRTLANVSLGVMVRKGLDQVVSALESAAAKAPPALRAEVLYPVDRLRHVNGGDLELRAWNAEHDLAVADSVLAAVNAGKDPFARRTGDMKRHYMLAAANEVMPYRLYVPTNYVPTKNTPLIVALHGLGQTEDSFFDAYGRAMPKLAEQHGYIVVAPLGYRVDGGYGWGVGATPADPVARRRQQLSEMDVMEVVAEVRKLYNVDANRMYLMGHSMGAIGTWKIAAKFPDLWAAIGAFSGSGSPATMERMKSLPAFVVHGDNDPTVNVGGSRAMVNAMKTLDVDHTYIEVPGGNHTNVVEPNLPAMFQFFNARSKPGAR